MNLKELRSQVTSIAWDGDELTNIMDVVEAADRNRRIRAQQWYLSPGDKSQPWLASEREKSELEIDKALEKLLK